MSKSDIHGKMLAFVTIPRENSWLTQGNLGTDTLEQLRAHLHSVKSHVDVLALVSA
jgi:GMP synthase PP-ATPase subunit